MNRSVRTTLITSLFVAVAILAWQHLNLSSLRAEEIRLRQVTIPNAIHPHTSMVTPDNHASQEDLSSPPRSLPTVDEILMPFQSDTKSLTTMVQNMPVALATMEDCSFDEILALITRLQNTSDLSQKKSATMLASFLLILLGESDPERILDAEATANLPNGTRQEIRLSAFSKLAEKDPRKARALLDEAEWANEATLPLRTLVITQLAKADVGETLTYLESLGPNSYPLGVSAIASAASTPSVRARGWQTLTDISDTELRTVLSRSLIRSEFEEGGIESAKNAIDSHSDTLGAQGRDIAIIEAASMGLKESPETMLEWIGQEVSSTMRTDAIKGLVSAWANKDYNAVGLWLGTQTPSPERDAAIMAYAQGVAKLDPEAALAWASEITDEGQRESTRHAIDSANE